MVFNSIAFAIFFGILCFVMLLTGITPIKQVLGKHLLPVRHWILFAASYLFYGWWDWRFAILMLGLTTIAYLCSLGCTRSHNKIYIYIGVIVPLLILGVFKYLNFFIDSFTSLFQIESDLTLQIILPVGISFFTFQSLSYSIDVYRNKLPAEKSFLKVALYISFFPQLVAGPIVKAGDFLPQLYEDRNISLKNFEQGIQFFVFGLFKKIVIADNLSSCVDAVFQAPDQYHWISIIFAIIAYSIQIYCDFSGYSDMAIGCAKCLGYDMERNFNMPYISTNISHFWKRWHISLSNWLMEYLYFPLGGNRKGQLRTYINLFLTMLIGGLWHGANWTFVVWGAFHGLALCLHKLWMKLLKRDKHYRGSLIGSIFSATITYIFVCFCWIFFRSPDFSTAQKVISGIVTLQNGILYISSWTILSIILVTMCTAIAIIKAAIRHQDPEGYYPTVNLNTVFGLTVFFVVLGLSLILAYTGSNPFIYFQF